ncbi:alpha/beta hydrolase family protein [Zhongshania arctica]|uniref:Alpha/beta hydrolase family protein n=1 Tax=Zhongshania arctica TaxID=3238302 RepID=A0ABV3TY11_9GAMM
MRFSLLIIVCIAMLSNLYAAEDRPVPPPLAAYGKLPSIEDMVISPSGLLLATVTTIGEQRGLLIGRLGGEILHRYALGELKIRWLQWAGEDHLIVNVRSTQNLGLYYGGKYELGNLMIVNVKTGETDWPLHNSKKVFNSSFHTYRPIKAAGRWHQCLGTLPMNSSIRSGDAWISDFELDLTCIDLEKGKRRVIARGRKDGAGWVIAPELKVLAYETYDDVDAKWKLIGYESRSTLVKTKDKFGLNNLVGVGRTPGTVAYYQHDRDGVSHLMEIAVDGQTQAVELYADTNINRVYFDAETGLLAGVLKEADIPELEMLDPNREAIVRGARKAFPESNVHFRSASADWQQLIVYTTGAGDSGTWWLVDISKGDAKPIGYDRREIQSKHVGLARMWQYKAQDGLAIPAIVTTPPGAAAEKMPLVVLPHGGPQSRDYLGFDWLAQAFASRGYVVLQPNFRGSGNYSVAFRNAGFGQWGRKMQTDLSDGVKALANTGLIDPSRVCIVGASYGGYAALAGVTIQNGIYRCAVSIAGLSDLPAWLRSVVHDRRRDDERYVEEYLGVDSSRADELEAISPAYLAARADSPILLIHGEDDTRVPIYQSKKMYSRLKKKKKVVEFVELEGEDHFLSRSENRLKTLESAVKFVMEHNPPGVLAGELEQQ